MTRRVTRRAVTAGIGAVLAGCLGGDESTPAESSSPTSSASASTSSSPDNPAVGDAEQVGDIELTSPAFDDGEPLPEKYGRGAENVSPPLSIRGVPESAESLTLVVDDPDAVEPAGEVWLHWLVWNVPPATTEIPERWKPTEAVEGRNDFGERGYDGPAPPDGEHTYRFKLYAVDTTLDLDASASKREVGRAMRGHVLAQTQLEGTYAPN